MIVAADNVPKIGQEIELMVCWLNEKAMMPRGKYTIKHTTKDVKGIITNVDYKIDINTLNKNFDDKSVGLNEIAKITIKR